MCLHKSAVLHFTVNNSLNSSSFGTVIVLWSLYKELPAPLNTPFCIKHACDSPQSNLGLFNYLRSATLRDLFFHKPEGKLLHYPIIIAVIVFTFCSGSFVSLKHVWIFLFLPG